MVVIPITVLITTITYSISGIGFKGAPTKITEINTNIPDLILNDKYFKMSKLYLFCIKKQQSDG